MPEKPNIPPPNIPSTTHIPDGGKQSNNLPTFQNPPPPPQPKQPTTKD
jgi:hypothetical protein